MDLENIRLSKYNNGTYIISDRYLDNKKLYGYKNAYNYYEIDVDTIILYKKCDNEYFIRYNINKNNYVPLQLIADEFFMVNVYKYTSLVEVNYRHKLVIVLNSVTDDYLTTSLVQYRC